MDEFWKSFENLMAIDRGNVLANQLLPYVHFMIEEMFLLSNLEQFSQKFCQQTIIIILSTKLFRKVYLNVIPNSEMQQKFKISLSHLQYIEFILYSIIRHFEPEFRAIDWMNKTYSALVKTDEKW